MCEERIAFLVSLQDPHARPTGGDPGSALRELPLGEAEANGKVRRWFSLISLQTHTSRSGTLRFSHRRLLVLRRAADDDVVDKDQILLQKEAEVRTHARLLLSLHTKMCNGWIAVETEKRIGPDCFHINITRV